MSLAYIEAGHNYTEKPKTDMFNMHSHEDYEIYCFLKGNAKYYVEGSIYPLKQGDILLLKKAESHSLLVNSEIPYERIVINFTADALFGETENKFLSFIEKRPLGKYSRYPVSYYKNNNWLYYLNRICKAASLDEKRIYLTAIVNELSAEYPQMHGREIKESNISDIINYINLHLTEELTVDAICEKFFISKTHLIRQFKSVVGTTVWNYILIKRLILAKEFLQSGNRPTTVYLKCGFNDYCTFFKAYKAKFGCSPKEDYNPRTEK